MMQMIREKLASLFKATNRPGAPTALTAGLSTEVDPRNSWTPDLEGRPPEEVAAFVTMLHDKWMQARSAYDPIWYTDLAFWVGQQWALWDPNTARLRLRPSPSWRRRITINKIMPTISTLRGKINRSVHHASCFPLEETPTAYADSRMGERVLRALHSLLTLGEPIDEATDWTLITGNGFLFVGFDPTLGDRVTFSDGTSVRTGEIDLDSFGPFEALAPADMKSFRKPGRFMRVKLYDIEAVRKTWPESSRKLEPDSAAMTAGSSTSWGSRMMSLISPLSTQGAFHQSEATNSVYVLELWEDPEVMNEDDAARYPNGRQTVVSRTQQVVLHQGPNPYESALPSQSKIPIVHFRDHRKPDQFWGMSRIEQLIPIQENYNKARSDMVEARDITCRPVVNAVQGNGITRFQVRPGAIFERKLGTPAPDFMSPPQMSDYHIRDVTELGPRDFQDVSQVPEVTRGEMPYSQMPGISINLLQEAADTPLSNVSKDFARGLSKMYTFILSRVRQFYDEPRMLSYVGENSKEDVFLFLRDRHSTRLQALVTPESVFPESRAARIARAERSIELGVLDPRSETAIRLLEYGNIDTIWENDDLDRQNAWWENREMAQEQMAVVQPFDNHQVHLYHHRRFQKTPEWRGLSDIAKAMLEQHVQETIAGAAETLGATAGMTDTGAMPGGPPGTGVPGTGVPGTPGGAPIGEEIPGPEGSTVPPGPTEEGAPEQ